MGRRSINTTKSGKYMNPTDQARKEARKKELKKNKKQRAAVRAAVLKGKDPAQLLEEMEKIDEMEYNVFQPSPLNEKVLREKRKKLKETLDRVMRLYHTDEPELWAEMKRKEVEYEKRRFKRVQYYESVRHAEQVQIDEIPLPSATEKPTPSALPKINLPPPVLLTNVPPPSILKKPEETSAADSKDESKDKEPPGVPPTPPIDLFTMRELDSDYEESEKEEESMDSEEEIPLPTKKSIRFTDENEKKGSDDDNSGPTPVQQKLLSLSGQNIDEFMKEMENMQKKKEEERALEIKRVDPTPDVGIPEERDKSTGEQSSKIEIEKVKEVPLMPTVQPGIVLPQIPNPGMPLMFRPPPLRPGIPMGIRMPPGPPTGPRPNMLGPNMRMGIRMPPGPPMGAPPNRNLHHHSQKHHGHGPSMSSQSNKDPKSATITAKPQIRNLSADVTRFVPATVRVKRDDYKKPKPPRMYQQEIQKQSQVNKGPTKDDAYQQFMNEMQGLL